MNSAIGILTAIRRQQPFRLRLAGFPHRSGRVNSPTVASPGVSPRNSSSSRSLLSVTPRRSVLPAARSLLCPLQLQRTYRQQQQQPLRSHTHPRLRGPCGRNPTLEAAIAADQPTSSAAAPYLSQDVVPHQGLQLDRSPDLIPDLGTDPDLSLRETRPSSSSWQWI